MLLVLGLLAAGLCALLVLNTAAAAAEVRQRSLSSANADSQDLAQQLQLEVANKQAPAALASQARALGLVPDSNPAFLVVRADGSVVVMGSPAPASAAPVTTPVPKPTPKATATSTATTSSAATSTATGKPTSTPVPAPGSTPTDPRSVVVSVLPGGPR